jgi:hypothetical protein
MKLYDEIGFWLKRYIYLIPPFQLLVTLVISFIPINQNGYVGLGNSLGYSIATGLVYVAFFGFRNKYCLFTKISAYSLFFIAIFNFTAWCLVSESQYPIYENILQKLISSITVGLVFILFITKKIQK